MILYNEIVSQTIQYLNDQVVGKFSAHQPMIEKLIKEGYGFEDFKIVIDKKVSDWRGTKYEQYIRPTTLFGDKFQNYLHEQPRNTKNNLQQLSRCVAQVQLHDWKLGKKSR